MNERNRLDSIIIVFKIHKINVIMNEMCNKSVQKIHKAFYKNCSNILPVMI